MKTSFIVMFVILGYARSVEALSIWKGPEYDLCLYRDYHTNYCHECQVGFWPYYYDCLPCGNKIHGCSVCHQFLFKCFECEEGLYRVNDYICDECKNHPRFPNCQFCDNDGYQCFKCYEPYQLIKGKCVFLNTIPGKQPVSHKKYL